MPRIAAALLCVSLASPAAAADLPPADIAAIEAAIAEEMSAKNLPSVAVGIWIPGRGDYVAAKGAADLATGAPRGASDPFRIGSVTKTMIGTVVLQLAAEGALALDDPLAVWFPDFPNAAEITIGDLLRMRSGIVDPWNDAALLAYYADPANPPSMTEMIARAAAQGASFAAPDSETVYVNLNFILLDKIIADITGAPTREALEARIFAPLAMTASDLPVGPALPGPLHGYGWNATTQSFDDKTELDVGPIGGAGAAISSLKDLHVFTRALCQGGLVSPEAQAQRLETEPFAGGTGAARYGEGVATLGPFCGHNGTIFGFSTEAWYLPSEDAVIVVNAARLDADDVSMSGDLFGKIARALFPTAFGG